MLGAPQVELHQAMLEQCEWADRLGFDYVHLSEHHGAEDGYMPSPLVAAAAIAARTSKLRLLIAALLLPLHDPIRIAEDLAIVDLISRGRVQIVLAAGYVIEEFEMFGKDRRRRSRYLMDDTEAIKQAFSGEEFEFEGRKVRVTPAPFTKPRPPLYLGGTVEASARRAAGRADGFYGACEDAYLDECAKLGIDGRGKGWLPDTPGTWMLCVSDDPESDWQRILPYARHESQSYVEWGKAADDMVQTVFGEDLLHEKYLVLTPEQTIAWARANKDREHIKLHPLIGGLDPAVAWKGLHLFEEQVLPTLRAEGLA
jgi:hypothetical protein